MARLGRRFHRGIYRRPSVAVVTPPPPVQPFVQRPRVYSQAQERAHLYRRRHEQASVSYRSGFVNARYARLFDGTDDNIQTWPHNVTSAITMLAVVKVPETPTGLQAISSHDGTTTDGYGFGLNSGGTVYVYDGTSRRETGSSYLTRESGWALIGFSKAAGTAAATVHRYLYSTGAWDHTTLGATNVDPTPSGTQNHYFGSYDGSADFFKGWIAGAVVYDRALSNTEVEALVTATDWLNANPTSQWVFSQRAHNLFLIDVSYSESAYEKSHVGTTAWATALPFDNELSADVLSDGFRGTFLAGKWAAATSGTGGTWSEDDGRLRLEVNPSSSVAVYIRHDYSLFNSSIQVEVVDPGLASGYSDTALRWHWEQRDIWLSIFNDDVTGDTVLQAGFYNGGSTFFEVARPLYDSQAMRYVKISHSALTSRITWSYSADGHTWIDYTSFPVWFNVQSGRVEVTFISTDGAVAYFDNLNVPPLTVTKYTTPRLILRDARLPRYKWRSDLLPRGPPRFRVLPTPIPSERTNDIFITGVADTTPRATTIVTRQAALRARRRHTRYRSVVLGNQAAALDTSETRDLFITGALDVSTKVVVTQEAVRRSHSPRLRRSRRPVYLTASSYAQDSSTDRDLFVTGRASSEETRDLHLVGTATSSDERDLHLVGFLSSSDERDVFITGHTFPPERNVITREANRRSRSPRYDRRPHVLVLGNNAVEVPTTDERDLHLIGAAGSSDEHDLRLIGEAALDTSRDLHISGTLTSDDERDIHLVGNALLGYPKVVGLQSRIRARARHTHYRSYARPYRSLPSTVDLTQEVRITGTETSEESFDLRISGVQASSDERGLRLTGTATSTDERDTLLVGTLTSSETRDVHLIGNALLGYPKVVGLQSRVRAHRLRTRYRSYARPYRSLPSTVERTNEIHLQGTATSEHAQDLRIAGTLTSSTDRDLRLQGTATSSVDRDLRLTGEGASSTDRDLRIAGQTVPSRHSIVTFEANRRQRQLRRRYHQTSLGYMTLGSVSERTNDLRLTGDGGIEESRDVYITGVHSPQAEQDFRITGQEETTFEVTLRLCGGRGITLRDHHRRRGYRGPLPGFRF